MQGGLTATLFFKKNGGTMLKYFEQFLESITTKNGHIGSYEKDLISFGYEELDGNLIPFFVKRPIDLIWNYINGLKLKKELCYEIYTYIYNTLFVGLVFLKRPFVNITLGIIDSNGNKIKQADQRPNLESGECRVWHSYPKIDKKDNQFFEELLTILFHDNEKRNTIKKYLAQTYLEYRTQARPTAVFFGERGSGKSMFFNLFYKQIFPSISTQIPTNFKDFNGFLKNTFIIVEESQDSSVDIKVLGNLIKKWSGSSCISINEKNEKAYDCPFAANFFIASNQKPIHLTELVTDPNNNQYLVVNFEKSIAKEIKEFMVKHNVTNLESSVKERIGYYIKTELASVYMEILEARKNNHYRYGFPIPIDADVLKLSEMSETQIDNGVSYLLQEKLWTIEQGEVESEDLLTKYQKDGFLANQLLIEACNLFNLKSITYNNTRGWLDKQSIKWETVSKKINNKVYRGVQIIDFDRCRPEKQHSA